MENLEQEEQAFVRQDRPTGLVILLMLSTISSVAGLFSNLVAFIVLTSNVLPQDELKQKMIKLMNKFFGVPDPKFFEAYVDASIQYGSELSVVGFICASATLAAVIYMARAKRIGFHLYVAARILEIAMPPLIAGPMFFGVTGLIVPCLFIYFYSRFLKILNQ